MADRFQVVKMTTTGKPTSRVQTNTRYGTFTQAVYTAGDVSQFEEALPRRSLTTRTLIDVGSNVFDADATLDFAKINWNKYRNLTSRSVWNTFRYAFYKFKKAIFVSAVDTPNASPTFLPFSNAAYRNEFSRLIRTDVGRYATVKELANAVSDRSGYRRQDILPLDEWQANNSVFRYELSREEGDNNVVILKDMFDALAVRRSLPDVEFFVNRRDYPLLTFDAVEPYNHLYGDRTTPLVSHAYDEYSPILSCSTADEYADLPMPTYEDWARATYQESGERRTFPNAHRAYPEIVQVDWTTKRATAVFRGSSTGAGTTPATNQRLRALELSESGSNRGRLDVGIVAWNLRPRKREGDPYLRTIERRSYPKADRLTLQQQSSRYKYILTLEGHTAANRLSYELSSGSVVLLAASRWKLWYYRLLKPFVHYVPVAEDLSDLFERVDWCRANDERCRDIAAAARDFYDRYLGTRGILDYLQLLLVELSVQTGVYAYLPDPVAASLADERSQSYLYAPEKSTVAYPYDLYPGPRCVGRLRACSIVLRSSAAIIERVRTLFDGRNATIELVRTNGFYAVSKTAKNDDKRREHRHEAFIGTAAVNSILARCPNFAYTHGTAGDADDSVYSEYVSGPTLAEWLVGDDYSFDDYAAILIQLNLALAVAQTCCAFVHYDLYPWNVIVQRLDEPVDFDYYVGGGRDPVRYSSRVVPIAIDFGKSRAVVYDRARDALIDRGIVNAYAPTHRLNDTVTLLYSCYVTLERSGRRSRLDRERSMLEGFASSVGLPFDNPASMSKFGNATYELSKRDREKDVDLSPMTFVDYLTGRSTSPVPAGQFSFKTARGSASVEASTMRTGDRNRAIAEAIVAANRETRPTSTNRTVRAMIAASIRRRLRDFDELTERSNDDRVRRLYARFKRSLLDDFPDPKSADSTLVDNFPSPDFFALDAHLSPEFVSYFSSVASTIRNDWISALSFLVDAALYGTDPLDVSGFDSFRYLNAVASVNAIGQFATLTDK